MRKISISLFLLVLLWSCSEDSSEISSDGQTPTTQQPIADIQITTDKARYNPGEVVVFTVNSLPTGAKARYRHLGSILSEETISSTHWNWTPPTTDFKGYMVELFSVNPDGSENILGTVGVDVSSDWTKFPRYGFVSKFGQMSASEQQSVIDNLNKYHINGLQFYDWMYRQHQPLAGTVSNPMEQWNDIMNRQTLKTTVENYISKAHDRNMKAMFYNLCYGVLDDYDPNQIPEDLFLYRDQNHSNKDKHELPKPPFISDIYLTDPSRTEWQNYLANENDKVYQVFDFDGFHIDQLGDRGNVFKHNGASANLSSSFAGFISAMKQAHPNKYHVFNAVNQYGQQQMATSELDFLYTEVWSPNELFSNLADILQNNHNYSGGKNSVLAAYMNYDRANSTGYFNTPGVLLTDAVIFAHGGAHLELGEHMLAKEYFPNQNLAMTPELRTSLVEYYDFLTAYENLLRDGGQFNQPTVSSGDGKMNPQAWPPAMGKVAIKGKQVGSRQVVHFLNFTNANSLNWRDTNGTQATPQTITNAMVNIQAAGVPTKVWFASPDYKGGAVIELPFTMNGNSINVKLPQLKYWSMLVLE